MNAEVEIKTLSSLDPRGTPVATDLIMVMAAGLAKKLDLGDVRIALAVATATEKGLMSATDKSILGRLNTEVGNLYTPQNITLASATSLALPPDTLFVTVTGTTEITSIANLASNRPTYINYPTGAGIVILGETVKAGDPPLAVIDTA